MEGGNVIRSSCEYINDISAAAAFVRAKLGNAQIALVLGSGLSGFTARFETSQELAYNLIPSMPQTTVVGHSGKLVLGKLPGQSFAILCFAGRVHAYEGYDSDSINFFARLSAACGCRLFVLTNSAGGALKGMQPGSIMAIRDHIRFTNVDPLESVSSDERLVRKGLNLSDGLYSDSIAKIARQAAEEVGIDLHEGVYCWSPGPTYETKSEVQCGIRMGVGAFGMSTVPEVLASAALGLEVFAVSLCTNMAAGLLEETLLHEDVTKVAQWAGPKFESFLIHILSNLKESNLADAPLSFQTLPAAELQLFPARLHVNDSMSWSCSADISADADYLLRSLSGIALPTCVFFLGSDLAQQKANKLSNLCVFHLADLPKFVATTLSGRSGLIFFGVSDNGDSICVVQHRFEPGFSSCESDHILRVLARLGIASVVQAIRAFSCVDRRLLDSSTSVCDVVNRTRTDVHPLRASMQLRLQCDLDSSTSVMSFPGPTPPTRAELALAPLAGCSAYTMSSIAPALSASAASMQVSLIATVDSACLEAMPKPETLYSMQDSSPVIQTLPFRQENMDDVEAAAVFCRAKFESTMFQRAIVVDSGLAALTSKIVSNSVETSRLPQWPDSDSVLGARWKVSTATFEREHILVIHADDGLGEEAPALYNMTFAIRLLKLLGVQSCVLASKASTANESEVPLDSVVTLRDHINLSGRNPLCGPNDAEWGTRFPDLSRPYVVSDAVPSVVAAYPGPTALISEANGKFATAIGASVICNGIAPEVIVASHVGVKVSAVCWVNRSCTSPCVFSPLAPIEAMDRAVLASFRAISSSP